MQEDHAPRTHTLLVKSQQEENVWVVYTSDDGAAGRDCADIVVGQEFFAVWLARGERVETRART